jgi:hypothetical protein
LRVFWASYTLDEDGVQHLYQSGTYYLDPAHRVVRFEIVMPTSCLYRAGYIAHGPVPVPKTITTGTDMMVADPFREGPPNYAGGFIYASDKVSCPTPPSASPSG